jgi:hypothetical protein
MDHLGNAGAVTFLEGIMHPISVARAVMEKTPHVMLSGAGALKFALDQGFKKQNLLTPASKKAWEEWKKESKYKPIVNIENHDTIGLLGIGKAGEIAGACSTSGLAYKMHGRVGDSPIIGGAVFCDDEVGGACATGLGEFVMKTLGSFLIVEFMRQGMSPQKACEEAIMRIVKRYKYQEFQVGYLALNKKGEYGAYSIQKGFNFTRPDGTVAQYKLYSQLTLLNAETDKIKPKDVIAPSINSERAKEVFDPGLCLKDVGAILKIYGTKTKMTHASEPMHEGVWLLRDAVINTIKHAEKILICNFFGRVKGMTTGGHYSVVGAYDEETDSVLVMDPAAHKNPWYWVSIKHLYKAMHTKDGKHYRGWIVVSD